MTAAAAVAVVSEQRESSGIVLTYTHTKKWLPEMELIPLNWIRI